MHNNEGDSKEAQNEVHTCCCKYASDPHDETFKFVLKVSDPKYLNL